MSNLQKLGIFVGGALVGGLATRYVMVNKYEQILKEEVQSVKDVYKNRTGIDEDFIARKEIREEDLMENCDIEEVATNDNIREYNEQKNNKVKHDYTQHHKTKNEFKEYKDVVEEEPSQNLPPTLIDEEEVGMHGFDMKVLTYYSDGVLVDESDTVLDINTYVGDDNIKMFEENPGATSMFVRNEETGIDYEVTRDDMTWADFALEMGIDNVRYM